MATATPWGMSQQSKKYATGINFYSTARHGGFKLSDGRMAKMSEEIKSVKTMNPKGWFEEDCEWALVALAFPEVFTEKQFESAVESVKIYFKDQIDVDS